MSANDALTQAGAKAMKQKQEYITVKLPIVDTEGKLGGRQRDIATAKFADGSEGKMSAGFGFGSFMICVSVAGKRVLTVNSEPMMRALLDAAIDRARRMKKRKPKR